MATQGSKVIFDWRFKMVFLLAAKMSRRHAGCNEAREKLYSVSNLITRRNVRHKQTSALNNNCSRIYFSCKKLLKVQDTVAILQLDNCFVQNVGKWTQRIFQAIFFYCNTPWPQFIAMFWSNLALLRVNQWTRISVLFGPAGKEAWTQWQPIQDRSVTAKKRSLASSQSKSDSIQQLHPMTQQITGVHFNSIPWVPNSFCLLSLFVCLCSVVCFQTWQIKGRNVGSWDINKFSTR